SSGMPYCFQNGCGAACSSSQSEGNTPPPPLKGTGKPPCDMPGCPWGAPNTSDSSRTCYSCTRADGKVLSMCESPPRSGTFHWDQPTNNTCGSTAAANMYLACGQCVPPADLMYRTGITGTWSDDMNAYLTNAQYNCSCGKVCQTDASVTGSTCADIMLKLPAT